MKKSVLLVSLASAFALLPGLEASDELAVVKAQIQRMQDQNALLRAQLEAQESLIRDLMNRVAELEGGPNPRAEAPPAAPHDPAARQEEPLPRREEPGAPALFIKGFADLAYQVNSRREPLNPSSNSFSLNELDLLLTSQLSDELSVLTEMVFHFTNQDEGGFFELERAHLTYAPRDFFKLRLGRMHTPMGYWNHTYHHGRWFQTTVSRPDIHAFEDEGGLLPEHSIGVEVLGTKTLGVLELNYSGTVVNGRGERLSQVLNHQDRNDGKGLNLHLSVAPQPLPGLRFGLSSYIDQFPPSNADSIRTGPMDELILAGHLVYVRHRTELLGELVRIYHEEETGLGRYTTTGLYLQGARQFKAWKPYYRFDYIDFSETDPLFPDRHDVNKHTLGVRWDPATWMALKLEYRYGKQGTPKETYTTVLQSAFTF
jgi:hypothetical protein